MLASVNLRRFGAGGDASGGDSARGGETPWRMTAANLGDIDGLNGHKGDDRSQVFIAADLLRFVRDGFSKRGGRACQRVVANLGVHGGRNSREGDKRFWVLALADLQRFGGGGASPG